MKHLTDLFDDDSEIRVRGRRDTDRIRPDSLSPEEGVEMVKSEADYGEEWMALSLGDSFDALEGTDG